MLTSLFFFFFFNDTATTEIYTLSLHDALPICRPMPMPATTAGQNAARRLGGAVGTTRYTASAIRTMTTSRSEEHTSELQSQSNLVCRLLLEKKKQNNQKNNQYKYKQDVSHQNR